jgi:7-cyano-7-deazaguanine synthase in queuosine biosynthesis
MTIRVESNINGDIRPVTVKLTLHRRIGVLVSGGLDSALLYYLIKKLTLTDDRYSVIPYTITRNDGSSRYAQPVIDYIHKILGIEQQDSINLAISETDSELQVAAGMRELYKSNRNRIYIGIIQTLEEHALHGVPKPYVPVNSEMFNYPLKDLTKAHVVRLIIQLGLEKLFTLTHSCVYDIDTPCGTCNRCNERAWAFSQLGLIDPGTA